VAATRRLAAIMFTDIVGYTTLSQKDEAGALRLLRDQENLARPVLATHRGRKVKSMGDGLLIEFPNALDAVECGVELQRRAHERNSRKGTQPLLMRIGIHLGDVQRRGTDILGDAVNIASRVEPLAEPEGVCLSFPVYDQVHNKVSYKLERLGPMTLKGVQDAVEIYRVVFPWSTEEVTPAVPLLPRIAVLPFASISPDLKDEFFAEGLTEELTSVLSQLAGLRVIARTSVGQYKGTTKPVAQIGAELRVHSILEGSVRKDGDQLRITVQLIDVTSQEHIWSETYERRLEGVFALQTEVAKRVATALQVKVRATEKARLEQRPTVRPESYLAYLKGRSAFLAEWTEGSFREAKKQFELAIALDSTNASAYGGLADATRWLGQNYDTAPDAEWDRSSRAQVQRAIELDSGLAEAHASFGAILADDYDYAAAEKEFALAASLSPSNSRAHLFYAGLLEDEGRTDEALREISLAEEADPHSVLIVALSGMLLIMLRQFDKALEKVERLKELDPTGVEYHWQLAYYWYARSDPRRALQEADRAADLGHESPGMLHAWIHAALGDTGKAREILESMKERPRAMADVTRRAMGYGVLGELDECFALLDQAVEKRGLQLQILRNEPVLAPVRRDPRFAQLLKKMNLA
jgi:TolB-like protein/class 3 adenylate cyclase/tetratricopeptide (TPR) repeat protein